MSADSSRLIIALDVPSREEALDLAHRTANYASHFKIGSRLFTAEGPSFVRELKEAGYGIFLDLKFHDIPNTVGEAAAAATALGVDIFDVHAAGGTAMMKTAVAASREEADKLGIPLPRIIAITVLTSMASTVDEVLALAERAGEAGLDGVVSSAWEARAIRDAMGPDFLIITPGIRPSWAAKQDQRRVATPQEAFENGADYIVIGRPIRDSVKQPSEAARLILEEANSIRVRE